MNELYNLSKLKEDILQLESIEEIRKGFIHFDKFSHKGNRGHAALFAGSEGMMGAALLAGSAANKSGTGKTTLLVPSLYFSLIHQYIPEVLVKESISKKIDFQQFNSIGIGPGIGLSEESVSMVKMFLEFKKPLVIDADAINIISNLPHLKTNIPEGSILTPHQKEWERFFGTSANDGQRIQKTIEFSQESGIYVIIKGHFSCLVTPTGEVFFNGTGNSGMAKGGSGDVLTGLLTGLLAQGFEMKYAAITGMYIHGLAGDLARDRFGEESMTATDQISQFGAAFSIMHNKLSESV